MSPGYVVVPARRWPDPSSPASAAATRRSARSDQVAGPARRASARAGPGRTSPSACARAAACPPRSRRTPRPALSSPRSIARISAYPTARDAVRPRPLGDERLDLVDEPATTHPLDPQRDPLVEHHAVAVEPDLDRGHLVDVLRERRRVLRGRSARSPRAPGRSGGRCAVRCRRRPPGRRRRARRAAPGSPPPRPGPPAPHARRGSVPGNSMWSSRARTYSPEPPTATDRCPRASISSNAVRARAW